MEKKKWKWIIGTDGDKIHFNLTPKDISCFTRQYVSEIMLPFFPATEVKHSFEKQTVLAENVMNEGV